MADLIEMVKMSIGQKINDRQKQIKAAQADMECFVGAGIDKERVFKLPGHCMHTEMGPIRLDGVRCKIVVKKGEMTTTLT
jgi:hypothetical protein